MNIQLKLIDRNLKIKYDMTKAEIKKQALAKLTQEEKEALGLIKKKRVKKGHKLTVNYMIGDSDGNTKEMATISLNNPFLSIIKSGLGKITPQKGYWGIGLKESTYGCNLKRGIISEMECDILTATLGYGFWEEDLRPILEKHGFESSEENIQYLYEFDGLFLNETSYSYLSFEQIKVTPQY